MLIRKPVAQVFEAFVVVKNWGFGGDADKVTGEAINSTGGFNLVLAALKVFLEHGIEPNFVVDHDPDALVEGWDSRRSRVATVLE